MSYKLIGPQCVFPGCIRPVHGAGLCWPHYQSARPFDPDDAVSVEIATDRLIARLAPTPADQLAALDAMTSWDFMPIPDWVWEQNADLAEDARGDELDAA